MALRGANLAETKWLRDMASLADAVLIALVGIAAQFAVEVRCPLFLWKAR
jgi:hypothetical protein